MATCPCNCGRKVSFNRRGAATGYTRVMGMLNQFGAIADGIRGDGGDPSGFLATRDEGEKIAKLILDHVHKVARPGIHPHLLDLAKATDRWQTRWQAELLRAVGEG